jgi:alpha-D-xyloside xylohydrolase
MKTTKALALIAAITISSLATTRSAVASIEFLTKDSDGITFTLDKGRMKVKICKDDIINVKYTIWHV